MNQTEGDNSTMGKREQSSLNNSSDNSSCSSKNNVPLKTSFGRYCHIVKRPDFDGYGFNLHSEKVKPGQYIGKVDTNSPAEAAGLREGDQIIEVNGVNIGAETHKQVVQRIKAISNEVRLLLIDSNTEGVTLNTKNSTNISEKNTVNNQGSTSATTNVKSPSKVSTVEPNSPVIVPANDVAAATTSEDPKEYITSISMVSTKSQSTNRNNPIVDVTDTVTSTNNGHHAKANGQTLESIATTTTTTNSTTTVAEHTDSTANNSQNNKTGLNLNLTAAEMRAKLLAKKKFDPKNESVDLKKKFDIIQKL